ncbi:MAG: hypothetical protein V2A54_11420 [Bacteroidota bacterium]
MNFRGERKAGKGNTQLRKRDDENIVDAYLIPFITEFNEKDTIEKMCFIYKMNDNMKAVFGFHLYYKKVSTSFHEFKYRTLHFILIGFFEEIIVGARHCKEDKMIDLLRRIRKEICEPLSEEVNSEKKTMNLEALYTELLERSIPYYQTISGVIRTLPEKLSLKADVSSPASGA